MEHAPSWLINSLIYLGAAVVAVPFSKALGLGSIIGYLAAGMAIVPWGLGLVTNVQDILHFAEFGVVLMLFLVGLELEPKRLWSMRRPILGGEVHKSWDALPYCSWPYGLRVCSFLLYLPHWVVGRLHWSQHWDWLFHLPQLRYR